MKSAIFLFAIFVSMFTGTMVAQQEEIQDHFLSSGCGGGPSYVGVTEETLQRHLILGAMPNYPPAARTAKIRGVVVLTTLINTVGDVTGLEVISGNPILARAATKAVKQWKYRPFLVNGTPIHVRSDVALMFRLGRKPSVVERSKVSVEPRLCSSDTGGGMLSRKVDPEFPTAAKLAHIQGDVVIEVVINNKGDITEAKVKSGHPILIEAALNAVKQWKYEPFMVDGIPVAVESRITIRFHM